MFILPVHMRHYQQNGSIPNGLRFAERDPPLLSCLVVPREIEAFPERPLKSVQDVTDLLAETINHLRAGRLDPPIANTVGYLATAMLKSLQQERRRWQAPSN
jgi:hypothetical protein